MKETRQMPRLIWLTVTASLVLTMAGLSSPTRAGEFDWTGWLGPHRNGRVDAFQPPRQWPDQLTRVWQVDVGTGYGTPLVVDDHVFQHARQGEEEVVFCLDRETGEQKWRQSYPVPFKMGGGGQRHGKGPKSCPVISDGRLFTMSITGVLSAWDAQSGDLLWRRDERSRFGKGHPYWGASTSPIVDGDRVIVHFGDDESGELVAMDVTSGQTVWSQGKDGASYSSPILAEIHGVRQVIEWNHRALVGVESESGKLLWEFPFPHEGHNQNMPTPAVLGDRVLVGGENRGIYGLQLRLDDDRWTVDESWHQSDVALDMSTAVINDGLLYGMSHYGSGRLFCLDPASGKVLWQGPGRVGQNVTFLSVTGHVIALINDGQLQVIEATGDQLRDVASYQVAPSDTWAPPVLIKGGLLIKDKTTLTRWAPQH